MPTTTRTQRATNRDATRNALGALARDIAVRLGDSWQIDAASLAEGTRYDIVRPNPSSELPWRIRIESPFSAASQGRIVVYGIIPHNYSVPNVGYVSLRDVRSPHVGFSASRGGLAIMRGIRNRLMPLYNTRLSEANTLIRAQLQRLHARELVNIELRAVLGVPLNHEVSSGESIPLPVSVGRGSVTVYDSECTVALRMTHDQAIKFLRGGLIHTGVSGARLAPPRPTTTAVEPISGRMTVESLARRG